MGEMGKGEMGTAHAGKPPSLPRELRTPLVGVGLVEYSLRSVDLCFEADIGEFYCSTLRRKPGGAGIIITGRRRFSQSCDITIRWATGNSFHPADRRHRHACCG
jgi:hypothetical protein